MDKISYLNQDIVRFPTLNRNNTIQILENNRKSTLLSKNQSTSLSNLKRPFHTQIRIDRVTYLDANQYSERTNPAVKMSEQNMQNQALIQRNMDENEVDAEQRHSQARLLYISSKANFDIQTQLISRQFRDNDPTRFSKVVVNSETAKFVQRQAPKIAKFLDDEFKYDVQPFVPFVKRKPVDENYSELVREAQRKIDSIVTTQQTAGINASLKAEVDSLIPHLSTNTVPQKTSQRFIAKPTIIMNAKKSIDGSLSYQNDAYNSKASSLRQYKNTSPILQPPLKYSRQGQQDSPLREHNNQRYLHIVKLPVKYSLSSKPILNTDRRAARLQLILK